MAPTESRTTPSTPTGIEPAETSETLIVWPDPSPLDAWWRRVMHADRSLRTVA